MNSGVRRNEGFTLVEILVALTIFAISIAVLLQIMSVNLDRTRQARDQTVAASLLQSLLAQTATAVPIQPGDTTGYYPNGYRWHLHVEPYGGDSDQVPSAVSLMTVVATVSWRDGDRAQSRSLATLRTIPVPASQ